MTSLEAPGQFGATVVRKIGDDWLLLQVDRNGLFGPDRGVYYATADCSGQMYFDVGNEFGRLASPVSIDLEGRGYFARSQEVIAPPQANRVEVFVEPWGSCSDHGGQPASEETVRPFFCTASVGCGEGSSGPPPLNGAPPAQETDVLTCCTPAFISNLLAPVQVLDPAVLAVSPPLRLR